MGFAEQVKNDLININNTELVADKLELEAMLRLGGEIILSNPMKMTFTCNSMGILRHFIKLWKVFYSGEYDITSRKIHRFDNHTIYTCTISDANSMIEDLNLIQESSKYKMDIFTEEEWINAYLRGAFLVRGSVNDPKSKNSHLEIYSDSENEILSLQRMVNYFELNARITKRKNYLVLYLKSKGAIGDFLYGLGATSSMEYYENITITKEILANSRRTVNLDIANQNKTNEAANELLKCIKYLEMYYPMEKFFNTTFGNYSSRI